MKKPALIFGAVLLLLSAIGAVASVTFPRDSVVIDTNSGQVKLSVEVATTQQQQEQGLMFRKSMQLDHGMIFNLNKPQHVEMWMKNTILPLDMVFVDNRGIVSQIVKNAVPESEKIISSNASDILMVIEINGGAADHYHIEKGDKVIYSLFK